MSEGGQRGTGNDYVLCLFFILLLSHVVRVRGETERTPFRLLEELVRAEMALNSCPG